MDTPKITQTEHVAAAAIYAFLGILIFALAFFIIDRLTPGHLWKAIAEEKNTALAIFLGCCALAVGLIIAAAVNGG
jgi:uncharacterized membrane protein YjfL (UPF0719 family)